MTRKSAFSLKSIWARVDAEDDREVVPDFEEGFQEEEKPGLRTVRGKVRKVIDLSGLVEPEKSEPSSDESVSPEGQAAAG